MATQTPVISHWYRLIEEHQASSVAFYQTLESALSKRQVPELVNSRVEFKEAGLMSANREYLHITRGPYSFDICAAPFGTGFFYSWWLTEPTSPMGIFYLIGLLFALAVLSLTAFVMGFTFGVLFVLFGIPCMLAIAGLIIRDSASHLEQIVLSMPLAGRLYAYLFSPATYFRIDSALMFQEAVHNAVVEVIDATLCAQGLRALSEAERKPTLKAFAHSA